MGPQTTSGPDHPGPERNGPDHPGPEQPGPEANLHLRTPALTFGPEAGVAPAVLVVVHGRSRDPEHARAQIVERIGRPDLHYVLPAADAHSWYPGRFLEPLEVNGPRLGDALELLGTVAGSLEARGVPSERVVWVGTSQGACLVLEWVSRHPRRWGGLVAFSGGLVGPPGTRFDRPGDLQGTPVFIGVGDADDWAPLWRVEETAAVFRALGARVDLRVYPGMGHVICDDEHEALRHLVAGVAGRPT